MSAEGTTNTGSGRDEISDGVDEGPENEVESEDETESDDEDDPESDSDDETDSDDDADSDSDEEVDSHNPNSRSESDSDTDDDYATPPQPQPASTRGVSHEPVDHDLDDVGVDPPPPTGGEEVPSTSTSTSTSTTVNSQEEASSEAVGQDPSDEGASSLSSEETKQDQRPSIADPAVAPSNPPPLTPARRRVIRELSTHNREPANTQQQGELGRTRRLTQHLEGGATSTLAAICRICDDTPVPGSVDVPSATVAAAAVNADQVETPIGSAQSWVEVNKMDLPNLNTPLSEDPLPLGFIKNVEAEPQNFEDVEKSRHKGLWMEAMDREVRGLVANKTFSPVNGAPNRKAVDSKWIFKWKKDQDGNVVKAKARLVARGFSQIQGVDYFDTFAPTPSTSSIRLLVCVAPERDLEPYHFDAEQAFVQNELDTDVYMRMPRHRWREAPRQVRVCTEKSVFSTMQIGYTETFFHLALCRHKRVAVLCEEK